MKLKKATDYAFVILAHLGTIPDGKSTNSKEVAKKCKIPERFLANIVHSLSKAGIIETRKKGSLITMHTGTSIPYAIDKLQDRGRFFVDPGEEVYAGQVIGENTRDDDILVNITKTKKQSNVRASGTDDKSAIAPAIKFSLEQCMEYIKKDEYVEVTPKSIRLRKIILDEHERKRSERKDWCSALTGIKKGESYNN